MYRARVNPVATFPGQGTVLFGDKTGLTAPSAFDRINVRRLFIVLEKAISTASKFQLFEFNDEFTRANFRNIVEPFLREVQGRRGITDFLVAERLNELLKKMFKLSVHYGCIFMFYWISTHENVCDSCICLCRRSPCWLPCRSKVW